MTDTNRPSFRIHNRLYLSSGVLFYTINDSGQIFFMLQKMPSDNKQQPWQYEDFGGKSQEGDLTIEDVAFREAEEEINGALGITKEFIKTLPRVQYLLPHNKYALYLVKLDKSFLNNDLSECGEQENLFNVSRKVKWMTYRELFEMPQTLLHPRLQPEFKNWMSLLLV